MEKWNISELAGKLLKGTATKEEEKHLHQWYDKQQSDQDGPYKVASDTSRKEVNYKILAQIQKQMVSEKQGTAVRRNRMVRVAAACIILASSVLGLYLYTKSPSVEWIAVSVPLGESREITLPDQSEVWVNAGSSIRYPSMFALDERRVDLLNGQAFFEVTKDPSRPFHVLSGDIHVTVLGTSFDVKSYADERSARVAVQSGQVEVRFANNNTSERLLPGKMAIIQKTEGTMDIVDKDSGYIGGWMDGRIVFYNEPMGSVFKALERNYNVLIATEDQELIEAPLTIKLDKQPLGDILEVLKYIFDFDYKLNQDERSVKITKK